MRAIIRVEAQRDTDGSLHKLAVTAASRVRQTTQGGLVEATITFRYPKLPAPIRILSGSVSGTTQLVYSKQMFNAYEHPSCPVLAQDYICHTYKLLCQDLGSTPEEELLRRGFRHLMKFLHVVCTLQLRVWHQPFQLTSIAS